MAERVFAGKLERAGFADVWVGIERVAYWVMRAGDIPDAARLDLPGVDRGLLLCLAGVVDLDLVERPTGRLGPDADATLDEILRSSLAEAVADTERLLGPDRER